MTIKKPMSIRALISRHPWLAGFNDSPKGWNGLIDELAMQIETRYAEQTMPLNDQTFRLRQVKEKFGELRFYCDSAIPIHDLLQNATLSSTSLCQECGAPGHLMQNKRLWLRTLCEGHAANEYTPRPSLMKITVDGATFTFLEVGQIDAVMPSNVTAILNKFKKGTDIS